MNQERNINDPPMLSQKESSAGFLTNRDTSSIYTISNDSNVVSQSNMHTHHQRSSSSSLKKTKVRNSKTQRGGEYSAQEMEGVQALQKAVVEMKNQASKPTSSRAINPIVWLNAKSNMNTIDEVQSKVKEEEKGGPRESQKQGTSQNEISYLSKLQGSSLIYEPDQQMDHTKSKDKLTLEQIEKQKSSNRSLKKDKSQDQNLRESKGGCSFKNYLLDSHGSDSILQFNPQTQGFQETNTNFLSMSHNKMLKEALEHINRENQNLRDQLADTEDLLLIHKDLIRNLISSQDQNIVGFNSVSEKLKNNLNDQKKYLEQNTNLQDSQISFMTTQLDMQDLDQSSIRIEPKNKSKVFSYKKQNQSGYCQDCKEQMDKERQQFQEKSKQLQEELVNLKQEFQSLLQAKEQMLKSNQNSFQIEELPSSNRSESNTSRKKIERDAEDEKDEFQLENIEQALQPLLEKLTDPNNDIGNKIFFQDQQKRVFKIKYCGINEQEEEDEETNQTLKDQNLEENKDVPELNLMRMKTCSNSHMNSGFQSKEGKSFANSNQMSGLLQSSPSNQVKVQEKGDDEEIYDFRDFDEKNPIQSPQKQSFANDYSDMDDDLLKDL